MLVNTSRSGQFVMPYDVNNAAVATDIVDSPWVQALNCPNHRNIVLKKSLTGGRRTTFSMTVMPTEEYLYLDTNRHVTQVTNGDVTSPFGSDSNNGSPYNILALIAGTAPQDAQIRRRRFRWTRLWTRYLSGNDSLLILNDDKFAHGVQFMIRERSFTRQNLPYFDVHVRASIEFRGRHGQTLGPTTAGNSGQYLFPFTYAGANGL